MLELSDIDVKIFAAIVAAIASLVVAILGYLGTRKNQRDLEKMKAKFAESKAERDALRDYEYEARKRLYHECGPLLFLLLDSSERALMRIHNIARAAKDGNLSGPDTWLSHKYYKLSTWYILLGPLATLNLIQRRLTLLDLTLDYRIYAQYSITKLIYHSFGHDFKLARLNTPALPYDPHSQEAEQKSQQHPEVYYQQGIPIGLLDNAIDALILKEDKGPWRVMTFAEFEREYQKSETELRKAFDRIDYLFENFHPKPRPILWRILITQAHLYTLLLQTRMHGEPRELSKLLPKMPEMDRSKFDWRQPEEKIDDDTVLIEPFKTTEAYFNSEVVPIVKRSMQMTQTELRRSHT